MGFAQGIFANPTEALSILVVERLFMVVDDISFGGKPEGRNLVILFKTSGLEDS